MLCLSGNRKLTGEHDGVLDTEELGQRSLEDLWRRRHFVSYSLRAETKVEEDGSRGQRLGFYRRLCYSCCCVLPANLSSRYPVPDLVLPSDMPHSVLVTCT